MIPRIEPRTSQSRVSHANHNAPLTLVCFFPCRLHFEESPTSFQRERREDESPPLFRRQRVQLHRRRRRESRQAGQGSPDLLGAGVLIGRRVLKLPSEAFRFFRTSHQIDYQERFLSPIFFVLKLAFKMLLSISMRKSPLLFLSKVLNLESFL